MIVFKNKEVPNEKIVYFQSPKHDNKIFRMKADDSGNYIMWLNTVVGETLEELIKETKKEHDFLIGQTFSKIRLFYDEVEEFKKKIEIEKEKIENIAKKLKDSKNIEYENIKFLPFTTPTLKKENLW